MNDELKIGMSEPVLDVPLASGEVVVRDDHLVAFQHQFVDLEVTMLDMFAQINFNSSWEK